MTNEKKQIHKTAKPPAPPANYIPTTSYNDPATGELVTAPMEIGMSASKSNTMPVAANPAVKNMQAAVLDLYSQFMYYPMFHQSPNYREGNTPEYKETYEHGQDTFLTFLLNRYVNKSPVIGQEGSKPSTGSPKSKPENLIKLIDSLKNVGVQSRPNEISKPDGVWGNKTTNALKNVYAVAQAMLGLMSKLDVRSSNYSEASLEELKNLISKTNNAKAAQAITKNIADIKKLVGEFMSSVDRERGKFSKYVRQEAPFEATFGDSAVGYNAKDNQLFTAMSQSAPITLFNIPQDLATGKGEVPLVVGALVSKQSFDEFIKNNQITVNGKDPSQDKDARNELLSHIEQQVNAMNVTPPSDEKLTREVPF